MNLEVDLGGSFFKGTLFGVGPKGHHHFWVSLKNDTLTSGPTTKIYTEYIFVSKFRATNTLRFLFNSHQKGVGPPKEDTPSCHFSIVMVPTGEPFL